MSDSNAINELIDRGTTERARIATAELCASAEARINHRFNLKWWLYELPWWKRMLAVWILRPWFVKQAREQFNPDHLWNECDIDDKA